MRLRFLFLFSLLIGGLALLPASGSTGLELEPGLKFERPSTAYSGASISSFISARTGHTSRSDQQGDHSGTQIRQSPDVAVQASIFPACDAMLCLIAVLRPEKTDQSDLMSELPARQVLFKELFQVVIAPNAP